ncbi:MAG: hypothetical protein QOH41_2284 [Blastocatellia bacterium]|jgi:hypothetical protein|nr:hypothetical protein [Blastocatellia bacterium]
MSTGGQYNSSNHRILVLGSANHTKLVTAYAWDKLPKNLNIADFDVVILDLTPFQSRAFAGGMNVDLIPDFRQFARLIFSADSEVIAVGSPNFQLGSNPYLDSHWWLPMEPLFFYEDGETTRNVRKEFEFYFSLVRHWSFYYHAASHKPYLMESYAAVAHPNADSISLISTLPLAENRFQRPIGFSMSFGLFRRGSPLKTSGVVYWLPEPTEVSTVEAIDLILRERYGLRFETVAPDWIRDFSLPDQLPIAEQISNRESTIREAFAQLQAARERLTAASRFQRLLYDQGEDMLEPIVRDALRALGATVYEPKQRGREDGRLLDPFGRQGMLEVKGRTGNLRLSDVREVDQWARDAVADEEWESKAILVVNLQCQQNPAARKDLIPTNCASAASRFGISILTTSQLFQAIVADQEGNLDRKEFWDSVFAANGMCGLPDAMPSKSAASPAS